MVLELLKLAYFQILKKNIKKELFTYGYEYYSYGKVVNCSNINFRTVSMDYPSTGQYTKIRPILDWYIIAKFWIKGILSKNQL